MVDVSDDQFDRCVLVLPCVGSGCGIPVRDGVVGACDEGMGWF